VTYHVDLLLDDERRIASPVNMRLVLRVGGVVVAGISLLFIVTLFAKGRDAKFQSEAAQAQWARLEPQFKYLMELRTARTELRASSLLMESFRRTRLPLGDELAALQAGIPADIQLQSLRITQFAGKQKTSTIATRSYELHLTGKLTGDDPKESVDSLIACLSSPAFSNRVEAVSVPNNGFRKETVRKTPAGEPRTVWFFELNCRYRPRSFE